MCSKHGAKEEEEDDGLPRAYNCERIEPGLWIEGHCERSQRFRRLTPRPHMIKRVLLIKAH